MRVEQQTDFANDMLAFFAWASENLVLAILLASANLESASDSSLALRNRAGSPQSPHSP